jgi:tRNA(His) 5'-end guanylyltransferase
MCRKDEFGDRMKRYEKVTRNYLTQRTPVIIRLDGKAFHTFTRGFVKPFDKLMSDTMQDTMKYLCENIQGVVLGYTQSDEITLVLVDYNKLNTCGWFDYNIQKCASVAASMATMAFNKFYRKNLDQLEITSPVLTLAYQRAWERGGMFDARVFNVPKEEVCNVILWRQKDAERNSINMVGNVYFSHRDMQNKSCKEVKEMLSAIGVDWESYATKYKRGSCCVKKVEEDGSRPHWSIDDEIPIFQGEGRKYIDNLIYIEEN